MTNPSSPTPAVETLSEEALAEIEASLLLRIEGKVMVRVDHARALCKSLRAARADSERLTNLLEVTTKAHDQRVSEIRQADERNAALREQLAQAQEYSDKLARNYTALEDWILRIRIKLELQAKDADIEGAIDQLQSRLAQVEKERDDLRAQLEGEKAMDLITDRQLKSDVQDALERLK